MVNLGIIGIGKIAQDYIDLICKDAISGARITALCSRNREHMEQVKRRFPLLEETVCFTSYEELLSSGSVDAVIICTPHGLHPAMTLQAVKADIHVLVEKPVGISVNEVEQALTALESRPELVCGVLYNRRFSPAFQYIKTLTDEKAIGDFVRVSWIITNLYQTDAYYRNDSWRGSWKTVGGGLLMTQASHQLDLMQWICGMPSRVWARCSSVDRPICTENEAELFLTFPSGAHGHFIASAHECPGSNYLEICGTRGRISVKDDTKVELVQLSDGKHLFAEKLSAAVWMGSIFIADIKV